MGKLGFISYYTFAAMSSAFLMGGFLVLTGGEPTHGRNRTYHATD